MERRYLARIIRISSTIILLIILPATIAATPNQSLTLNTQPTDTFTLHPPLHSINPSILRPPALHYNPRPHLPYHVQVADSDTSVQFMAYYDFIPPTALFPCIIQALVEIYETALYDHGNAPLRGDIYSLAEYGVHIAVKKNPIAPNLMYRTVVRALQAVELFAVEFGSYGVLLIMFEGGEEVGKAVVGGIEESRESG